MSKIAVYGTLRRGFGMFLENSNYSAYTGRFSTLPIFRMYDNGYPCLVVDEKNGYSITVDTFHIRDDYHGQELRKKLDRYEGVESGLYLRSRMKILSLIDEEYDIYIWNGDVSNMEEIKSGDFISYRKQKIQEDKQKEEQKVDAEV